MPKCLIAMVRVCALAVVVFAPAVMAAPPDYTFNGPGNATLTVSGVQNNLSDMTLTIHGLSTTSLQTTYILLGGPGGRLVICANATTNAFSGDIAFHQGSPALPSSGPVTVGGTYGPTVFASPTTPTTIRFAELFEGDPTLIFDTTEGAGPWGVGSFANKFIGQSPNGLWTLKVSRCRVATPPATGNVCVTPDATYTTATLTLTTPLDLELTKTHTDTFKQGDTNRHYTIKVRNVSTTPMPSKTITVDDVLPTGLTATAITGAAPWSCGLSPLRCTATTTLAAASSMPDITVTTSVASDAPSQLTNHAQMTITGGDSNATNDSADDVTTVLQVADLSVSLDDGQTTLVPGDGSPITQTVVVQNNGPATITGAQASAFFSYLNNATFSKIASGGATSTQTSGGYVSDSLTMPAGSSMTYHITGTLDKSAPAGPLTNTASVSMPFDGFDSDTSNNSASDVDTITPVANLVITKTIPAIVTPGTDATWSVTLTNNGPSDAHNVAITDALPVPFVSQAQTSGFSYFFSQSNSGDTITDSIFSLGAGATVTFDFTGHVPPDSPPNTAIVNTVTVTSNDDPDTSDNTSTVTTHTPSPDLTIVKTHAGIFQQGDAADSYSIVVTNSGGAATSGDITVTDTLPPSLTLVSMSGTGWSCPDLTCTRSDVLPPAGSFPPIDVIVAVSIKAPPFVQNLAGVSGGGEANTSNDLASDGTVIVQMPDLTLQQNIPNDLTLGQTNAAMTFTVTNSGGTPTSAPVTFTESLPSVPGITVTALSGTGWSCSIPAMQCSRSDVLAATASYPAITMTFDVEPDAPNDWTSDASVAGGGEVDATNDASHAAFTIYAPFGPPFPFSVAATSATSTHIAWGPVLGALHYDIYRAPTINGPWQVIAQPTGLSYDDSGLTTGVTYVYEAKAVGASLTSGFSAMHPATPIAFTDDPLLASSPIKLAHIIELRNAVNAMRIAAALPPVALTPGTVQASDITSLQNGMREARNIFGLPDVFGVATIVSPGMPIRTIDMTRIRAGVQ
jgi:uncharacterized repeat protein (TIGR01451 family)